MTGALDPQPGAGRRSAILAVATAALLCVAALAVFWPGYAAFDSLAQYGQALTGDYDDWHPPVMARLWSLFGAQGPWPMLVVQMVPYALGFGGIAAALARDGRPRAALATGVLALWPPLLGWQAVVLKDTQMLGALLGAVGLVGWWRLRGAPVPRLAAGGAAVLMLYALLVRANAAFAVVPLAVMLIPLRWGWGRGGGSHWRGRAMASLAGIAVAIAVSGPIAHRVLGAAPSGVERTQAIYDLAGIAVRSGDGQLGLPAVAVARLRAKGCVRPFFWDPLGEPARCEAEVAGLHDEPVGRLYLQLALAMLRHPLDYAGHRLAHLNATDRWLVPARWMGAAPFEASEPNAYGFGEPGGAARAWQRLAGWLVLLPPGWPVVWLVLAAAGLAASWRGEAAATALARALFVSASTLEASFAPISIASDLRYHLWAMTAVALGWILLGRLPRGRVVWLVLAAVLAGGTTARLILPNPPQSYEGMLG